MTLPESMVSLELAKVDLTKVAALQQKRTLAFVNHFVITNVQFLNNFMRDCEQKLMNFERKLEKVNAAMVLLETRLSSIPELNVTTSTEVIEKLTVDTKPIDSKESENKDEIIKKPSETTESVEEKTQINPEYERFVKMVQVGVPLQAVKLKLSLEGLDPNVLDEILNK